MSHFFVLDIIYTQGAEAVNPHLKAHRQYLTRNYKNGRFLASGRKDPRTGGIIIAVGARNEISEVAAEDPFVVNGLAEYVITEFIPTMTSPHLENYRENLYSEHKSPINVKNGS